MSRVGKNILHNVLGQGALIVVSFVAAKVIHRQLGLDVLGLYFFSLVAGAVLTAALEFGLSSTIVREVAAHADDEPDYVRALVRSAWTVYAGSVAVLGIVCWVLVPLAIGRWVDVEQLPRDEAVMVLRIFLISAVLNLPRLLFTSVLQGLQRFGTSNLIALGASLVQQGGTLVVLTWSGSAVVLAGWYLTTAVVSIVIAARACTAALGIAILVPGIRRDAVRRTRRFAGYAMLTSLLATVVTRIDRLILSSFLPIAALGSYGLGQTAVSKGQGMVNSISTAGYPALAKAYRAGSLMERYHKLDDLICILAVPLFAAIAIAEEPLFTYVFDSKISRSLQLPVLLLCVGSLMNATISTSYASSLATGKPEIAARLNMIAAVVILPITIVLVSTLGSAGAGASWIVYHLLAYAYATPRFCRHCLDQMSPWVWYQRVGKLLAVTGLAYGPVWAVLVWTDSTSLVARGCVYALGTSLFLAGAYGFVASEGFRTLIRTSLASIWSTVTCR